MAEDEDCASVGGAASWKIKMYMGAACQTVELCMREAAWQKIGLCISYYQATTLLFYLSRANQTVYLTSTQGKGLVSIALQFCMLLQNLEKRTLRV